MKSLLTLLAFGALCLISCQAPSNAEQEKPSQAAAAAPTAAPLGGDIKNKYWKLIEINGQPVTNPPGNQKEAYLMFQDSSKLVGNNGCNQLMGGYEISEGNRIKLTKIATTMMACPDVAIEQEFGRNLQFIDNYSTNGNQMTLQKAKMAPMFRFEAVQQ